ncbi:helix-turn-helix transcriptional regulator [Halobacillus sp. A5]|uniref:helix-turn-helix domain-containing protein n=1 Tax=Halobacillus sp. A5 TaxID=2880263 RepID=UPI0020A65470|nr:helix-turn-helix transcriptional regulator [Halobacillus sp. A5]MCP3025393.1 helix-turn-helix transcriptional regulator [Halobacillus sp. A5]
MEKSELINVKPRLNKIMKERKLTQMKLSEMSGVTQGSISRFDNKTRHEASHLFSIAKALNLKIEDLFEYDEDKQS